VFFWVLHNRPGAVWVGTQKEWDWWRSEEGGACECPELIHEGMVFNFSSTADWSWWPRDIRSVFGAEWDESGTWSVSPHSRKTAAAIGCPFV
jgi:hypothetical protein